MPAQVRFSVSLSIFGRLLIAENSFFSFLDINARNNHQNQWVRLTPQSYIGASHASICGGGDGGGVLQTVVHVLVRDLMALAPEWVFIRWRMARQVLRYLLSKRVWLDAPDQSGATPLAMTLTYDFVDEVMHMLQIEIVKTLLESTFLLLSRYLPTTTVTLL
jgi:hypothetical protein